MKPLACFVEEKVQLPVSLTVPPLGAFPSDRNLIFREILVRWGTKEDYDIGIRFNSAAFSKVMHLRFVIGGEAASLRSHPNGDAEFFGEQFNAR